MNKRNFLHRLIDVVEHELEATLAVLIVLAAVVGYSLAATDTTTPPSDVTAQQVSAFIMNGKSYDGLAFASGFSTSSRYLVKRVTLDSNAPADFSTIKNKGIGAGTPSLKYEFSVTLSEPYSGPAYVAGTYTANTVTLNGLAVAGPNTPVELTDTDKLTFTFDGGDNWILGVTTNPVASTNQPPSIGALFVIPTNANLAIDGTLAFSVLATDTTNNKAMVNPAVLWSVKTIPTDIATINPSTGVLTAKAAGSATITAKYGSKSASATITITDAKETEKPVPAIYPGAEEKTKTPAIDTTKPANTTPTTPDNNPSLLDQLTELIAPASEAATTETPTEVRSIVVKATEAAVAVYMPTAVVQRVETTGHTVAQNAEVQAVVKAQPTLVGQFVARMRMAAEEIKQTVKEIAFGNKATGTPSAGQSILNFIKNITSGANAGTGSIMDETLGPEVDVQ